jgi:hypothetical protein
MVELAAWMGQSAEKHIPDASGCPFKLYGLYSNGVGN